MKSKTSCFNTTLFRKNFIRFWPIWALYLLIMLLMMPISLFKQAAAAKTYLSNAADGFNSLSNAADSFNGLSTLADVLNTGLAILPVCIFSVVSAIAVFSYLYNARSCYMIHALPLKRNELFITNYVSGFLFLTGPQIIVFLLSMIICIIQGITHVEYLFFWLLLLIGMTFFTYTLCVFCCQLSGNLFAVIIFYIIINFAYQCVRSFMSAILSSMCFGLSTYGDTFFYENTNDRLSILAPLYHLNQNVSISSHYDANATLDNISFTGTTSVIIYCIAAVILLVISGIFYKRRQLETVGDIIAVPWLIPVFRWLVALFGGLSIGTIVTEMLSTKRENYFPSLLVSTAIFTFIFFYVAQMLIAKKFKVFKMRQIPEFIICIGIMAVFLTGIKADWFHIEDYVPERSQISSVSLTGNTDIISNDGQTIDEILKIHQAIIDHKKDYRKYDSESMGVSYFDDERYVTDDTTEGFSTIYIIYYMKDGSRIERCYTIPKRDSDFADETSASSLIADIQSHTDYYFQYLISSNYKDATIKDASISLFDSDFNESDHNISQSNAQRIWEAYQKDAKEGHLGISIQDPAVTDDTEYFNTLSLYLFCEDGFHDITEIIPDSDIEYGSNGSIFGRRQIYESASVSTTYSTTYTAYLPLNANCSHTLKILKELGIPSDEARLVTNNEFQQHYDELEQK